MSKIAVIQTAFPGDVILATPVFEALKKRFSRDEIIAVVRPESARLLENNPYIDSVVAFDKYGADAGAFGLFRFARRLRGCDRAYILQRHLRSAVLAYLARIPSRVGFDNASGCQLYTDRIKYRDDIHEVERSLLLLNLRGEIIRPRLYPGEQEMAKAEQLIRSAGISGDFAVIAPGSIWPTKRYPYFPGVVHLLKTRFELPVILLGGPKDLEVSASVVAGSKGPVCDLTGKSDFLESAAIISKARIVIANDSAPSHIAAAMRTPVISIFGPTVPGFGFAPYSDNSKIVDNGELYCRPCSRHGSRRCPQKHFRCMLELPPSAVIEAVESLLSQ